MSETKIIGSVYDPIRVTATVAAAVVGAPGMVWRGTYNAARYYYENEVVYWNGSSWIANRYVEEGLVPGVSASWSLVAQSGTSVPWADPEVYVPGNLLQVNAGSDGFEDSGVPAGDVVRKPNPNNTNGAAIVIVNSSGDNYEPSSIIINQVALFDAPENFAADNIPIFKYSGISGTDAIFMTDSLKSIDNVKTELGYLAAYASAFDARKTDGAEYKQIESATYKQTSYVYRFDPTTSEGIHIAIPNYGSGSLTTANFKVKLHTKVIDDSTIDIDNNKVRWGVKAAIEQETIDQAWGTAVTIDDDYANEDVQHSDWSALVTASGTIAAGCQMWIEIYRDATNATYDTLAADIELCWAEFQFNLPAS